jgi:hypothetical protein
VTARDQRLDVTFNFGDTEDGHWRRSKIPGAISRCRSPGKAGPAKGALGRITIADELWAFVKSSEKRGEWCIEDSKGRCLRHASDLRGTANNHESAIELAMAPSTHANRPPFRFTARRDRSRRIAPGSTHFATTRQ